MEIQGQGSDFLPFLDARNRFFEKLKKIFQRKHAKKSQKSGFLSPPCRFFLSASKLQLKKAKLFSFKKVLVNFYRKRHPVNLFLLQNFEFGH